MLNLSFSFLQRTGATSLPLRTGPRLPLPRLLTGVVPPLTGLRSMTVATIKKLLFTLNVIWLFHLIFTEGLKFIQHEMNLPLSHYEELFQ